MGEALLRDRNSEPPGAEDVFERIACGLATHGHSVIEGALPLPLASALAGEVREMSDAAFRPATIGRSRDRMLNGFVRRDAIHWIDGRSDAERAWLAWSAQLQTYLNRRLFLGLFSFECHFAHYPPGAFYKRHLDAFRGDANRILTTVLYLNPAWGELDGGELLLYADDGGEPLLRLAPALGTLAVFLSEEFPHEVLPAQRDRYSIAGWFRVNTSNAGRVDPPR
ncbi:MAG: 2OG-Fe(II) oxygenase [Rhodocyclaceae bacterium]|nr:2OG-Fe(II) oxygenase [Rhodocyclaceae bacterium]